jgi:transcriptional regulator with XRE-family HTH domain
VADRSARWGWEKRLGAEIAQVVGPKIGRLRAESGLSQEELADRAGLHRTAISLLEVGKRAPRIVTLVVIAGVLEVPPGHLLDGIYWRPGDGGGDGYLTDRPPIGDATPRPG